MNRQCNPKSAVCKVCRKGIRQKPGPGRPRTTHEACKGKTAKKAKAGKKARKTRKKSSKPRKTSRKAPRKSTKGVLVRCVEENGKLRVRPISPGYDKSMHVQFPKDIRYPGWTYRVDALEDTGRGFYRAVGDIESI